MVALGFRCFKDAIAHVALEGARGSPGIVEHAYTSMPDVERQAQLAWLRTEVLEILDRLKPEAVSFKAPEPSSRTRDLQRGEAEGVFQEACHSGGHEAKRRIKSQLRADLRYEGKAKYVERALPAALASLPANRREAALAAVAALSDA